MKKNYENEIIEVSIKKSLQLFVGISPMIIMLIRGRIKVTMRFMMIEKGH